MASKTITFRFPEEVIDAIEARAKATGSNRTAVLMEALAKTYGLPPPSAEPISTATLQQQLHNLEQQVGTLLEQLAESVRVMNDNPATGIEDDVTDDADEAVEPQVAQVQLSEQVEYKTTVLTQVLSSVPDLIIVQDREGQFTFANAAGAKALGFEQVDVQKQTRQNVVLSEELKEVFFLKQETVVLTGQPLQGEIILSIDHQMRLYEYKLSPVLSSNGRVETTVCIARDITERQQVELTLRESEEGYRNLFEFANDSIFIVDTSTNRILNANRSAARRLGYARQELLQLLFTDVVLSEHGDRATPGDLQQLDGTISKQTLRCKNGNHLLVESSNQLIEYQGHLALQCVVRDIRNRR